MTNPHPIAATLNYSRLIPVVIIDDAARTPGLLDALVSGGIHCVEITLRTPAALEAIALAQENPNIVVGAGTVLNGGDVDAVVAAGAKFVVSPGLDAEVNERCEFHCIPYIPGVATATEVQRALRWGRDRLKFFPAEASGGIAAIEQLSQPFSSVQFMPSGGISVDNAARYAASDAVFAVSGSWMATRRLIADGDFKTIARLSQQAVNLVQQ